MGWGTSFTGDIYISKKLFRSQSELDSEINEIKEQINSVKETLLMYASSTPKDIFKDETDIIFEIKSTLNESFEYLEELHFQLFKLQLLQNAIDDKTYIFGQDSV